MLHIILITFKNLAVARLMTSTIQMVQPKYVTFSIPTLGTRSVVLKKERRLAIDNIEAQEFRSFIS